MGYIGAILEDENFKRDVVHMDHWEQIDVAIDGATSGFIVSVFALGCMISAFPVVSGFFLDRFGRRASLIFGSLVFLVGSVIQAASESVTVILVGRLISGCSIGILSTVVPLYQSELAPSHLRGSFASLHQVMVILGAVLAALGDQLLLPRAEGWRWAILLPVLPGLIFLLGMHFLPESPRWLVQNGQHELALRVLQGVRDRDEEAIEEIKDINSEIEQSKGSSASTCQTLCSGRIVRLLAVGTTLQLLQQLNGINAFVGFGPRIFNSLGFNATCLQTLLMLVCFVATVPAIYFIERLGRRNLLLSGAIGMLLSSVVITVLGLIFIRQEGGKVEVLNDLAGAIIVSAIFFFVASFAFSWGPVTWVYCAEIFPLRVRGPCVGLTTMSEWAGVFIVNQTTPMLLQSMGFSAFGIFAGFCLVAVLFTLWLPETRGVPLEHMSEIFDARFGTAHEAPATKTGKRGACNTPKV
jgi:sugar porter (SP) family MFS transporter